MKIEEKTPRAMVSRSKTNRCFDFLFDFQGKFVKTFNPMKTLSVDVSQLSGFSDEILKNFAPFSNETVKSIEMFLNDFPKPICFVGKTFAV